MSKHVCVYNSKMKGSVPHHNNHILYYRDEDDRNIPVYCNGHDVEGGVDNAGQTKLFIQNKEVFVSNGSGYSNDECDNSRFYPIQYSTSMFVCGKPVISVGDKVALNPGDGIMTNANQNKFTINR